MSSAEQEMVSRIAILQEALPFIEEFSGTRILVKAGGELFEDPEALRNLVADVHLLQAVGIQVVFVHGGGPQITRLMRQLGHEPKFIDGQRQTDARTVELSTMVLLGQLNPKIVAQLNVQGCRALGLSGLDDNLLQVTQRSEALGFVGHIRKVNVAPIENALAQGYVPVIAGLGVSDSGHIYNINADSAAGKIAAAIGAKKLVLLTNVEGLYERFEDKNSRISQIDSHGLIALLSSGTLREGMIPKMESILAALKSGVPRAHIIDGRRPHALLLEVLTSDGVGTMITDEKVE